MNLRDFLKKYSVLNNDFIDDFISIYDMDTKSNNDFKIDLDIVVKWLNVKKFSIKRTIVSTYEKDIDYQIIKTPNKIGRGGALKEQVLLTSDCFKRLCMLSRTEKAEQVRTYYITLEKLIDKYKNYIIEGLDKRIHELEKNQQPKVDPKEGVIYILKTDKDLDDVYRIGKSKKFKKRILSHNSSHIDDLEIVFIYETKYIDEIESCLKALLKKKQYRRRKEIFMIDLSLLKELLDGCEKMVLKTYNKPKIFKNPNRMYAMLVEK